MSRKIVSLRMIYVIGKYLTQTGSVVSAWNDAVLGSRGLPAVHADNIRAAEVCSAEATVRMKSKSQLVCWQFATWYGS